MLKDTQHIEVLDLRRPGDLELMSGRLLLSQIYYPHISGYEPSQAALEDYFRKRSPTVEDYYAITETDSGLLAASAVMHRSDGYTVVNELAVMPTRQGEGLARDMLCYIAERALMAGDSMLRLSPSPAAPIGFFTHMGFAKAQYYNNRFVADPISILGRSSSIDRVADPSS